VGDLGVTTTWLGPARTTPLVLAHRGSSAEAPENTIAAFRLARRDGADGVELDVLRLASGEVVVFHDDDLQRLCGVPGSIRALDRAALAELDVRGQAVPTLDEVLDELGPDLLVNVELKAHPDLRGQLRDDGLAAEVAAILRRRAVGARALVSSFDPLLLGRFRRLAPDVPAGLLFAADQALPLRRGWSAPLLRVGAVHPEAALVTEARMRRWRRRGLRVHVWTVDDPAELRYLALLGVDGIIANRPREARAVLEAVVASRAVS
jgi:glycerophosphoryl diester phosphodiesterase